MLEWAIRAGNFGDRDSRTAYAVLGEDRIAYQVFGDGELDLIWFPGGGDCVDLRWDWPPYAEYLDWLAARARVITFDRRGTGASDAPSGGELPPWEQWADDAQTVMDVVGSERAVLCGLADSVPAAILFAGTHPSRTAGLVLMNGEASFFHAGASEEELAARIQFVIEAWGGPGLGERNTNGDERLYEGDERNTRWRLLPSPPPATATVAYVASSAVEALAVRDTVLTVWNLDSLGNWNRVQTLHVNIQFGSSN